MQSNSFFKPPLTKRLKSGKISLQPGESVGEHKTEKREEVIVVLKGTASLFLDGETVSVEEGDTFFIKEDILHNVKNEAQKILEYVYVVGLL